MAGSSGAIRAGRAYVEVGADTKELQKALDDAGGKLKAFGAGIAAIGAGLFAAGAAGLTFFGAAVAKWAEAGTKMEELSKQTGASVESLSTLGAVAEENGSSVEELAMGFRRLSQLISKAAADSPAAVKALKDVGLTAAELQKMTPDQQLRAYGAGLGTVKDHANQTALAVTGLGRTGTKLGAVLSQGADGLAKAEQHIRDLGLEMTSEGAKAAHEFHTALMELWMILGKIVTTIGSALGPPLQKFIEQLNLGVSAVLKFVTANKEWVIVAAAVSAGLVVLGAAIIGVGLATVAAGAMVGSVITILTALATVAEIIVSPWLLIPAAILAGAAAALALAAAFLFLTDAGRDLRTIIGLQFTGLGELFDKVWGGIKAAIAGGDFVLAAQVAWAGVKLAVLSNTVAIQNAWVDVTAGMKAVWVVLVDALTNAWAIFVNKVLYSRQALQIALAGTLALLGQQALAADVIRDAMNQPWAKGVDAGDTADKLLKIELERQQGRGAVGEGIQDAGQHLKKLLGDVENARLEAQFKNAGKAEDLANAAKSGADLGTAVSRGTFNPAAVGALAGADKLSGVEEHTKKSAKHLGKIEKLLEQQGLDFDV